MRLLHRFEADHIVADFQTHQSIRELALGCACVVLSELHFEENKHVSQVLVCLFVQDGFDLGVSVVLHLVKVLLENKLAPDLNNLPEECFSLDEASFFLEQLTHVVVAAAHIITLWTVLVAL
jgi:thymidine kinase